MLWLRPYTWVNRNGSAAIASTGVVVNTANGPVHQRLRR